MLVELNLICCVIMVWDF